MKSYLSPDNNAVADRSRLFIQPKLTVNQPGDKYEQEADSVAEKVMRSEMPDTFIKTNTPNITPVQRKCAACEEEKKKNVQRKCAHCEEEDKKAQRKEANTPPTTGNNHLDTYVSSISGSGQPLSAETRNYFEPRFGRDFSNVRVHTDSVAAKSAQSINAQAYTTGNNIVFNNGHYAPGTEGGKKLLAHELTHVVQQGSNDVVHRKPLTKEEKLEDLQSDELKNDQRLQNAFDNSPVMRKNETSEGVKTLQRSLKRLGYPLPISFAKTGDADGILGDETSEAIKQFQRDNALADNGDVGRDTLRTLDEKFNPSVLIEGIFFGGEHHQLIDNNTDWGAAGALVSSSDVPYHIVFQQGQASAQSIPMSMSAGTTPSAIAKVKVKGGVPGESYTIKSTPSNAIPVVNSALTLSGSETFVNGSGEHTDHVFLNSVASLGKKITSDNFSIGWQVDANGKTNQMPVSQNSLFVTSNKASSSSVMNGADAPNVPTLKRLEKAMSFAKGQPADDPGKITFEIISRFPEYGACAIPYDPQWDTKDFKCPQLKLIWEMSDFEGDKGHFQCITIANYTNAVLNVLGVPNSVSVQAIPVVIWADPGQPEVGKESLGHGYNEVHPDHPDWGLSLVDGNCGLNNFEACVKLQWIKTSGAVETQYYCGGVQNVPGGFKDPTQILHEAFISLSYVKRMKNNDPDTGFPRGIRMKDEAVYNATSDCKKELP
ncbi:MAG: DUF4157 domain-containing protein [Chitinophagaceae bacterium]